MSQSLNNNNSTLMFDNGNGSLPRCANLSISYHCYISLTSIAISTIELSITSIISLTSTNIITTPSPSPINCSNAGIWPETLPGHNVTGLYCYKGTVNGK